MLLFEFSCTALSHRVIAIFGVFTEPGVHDIDGVTRLHIMELQAPRENSFSI